MGGDATFAGTTYQARVTALVYTHVLAQTPLGWIPPADDTPIAVSGETGGPGDDAAIEFGERHPPIEVQAKHGFGAGAKLEEFLSGVLAKSNGGETKVVLAVDRGSTRYLHQELPRDLQRLRAGRSDALTVDTQTLAASLGQRADVLKRVYPVAADVDDPHHPERKLALKLLGDLLSDGSQAAAAWTVLVDDASQLAARKLRRTRKDLVDILAHAGIKLRRAEAEERWQRRLDGSKRLIEKFHVQAALHILSELELELRGQAVSPGIRYRLAQQKASSLLRLGRFRDALACANLALDFDVRGWHALETAALASLRLDDLESAIRYCERAIQANPTEPRVWAVRAVVTAATGGSPPHPPSEIAASSPYRTALAEIATTDGDWRTVLDLTAGLLSENVRTNNVLFFRANALMGADASELGRTDHEVCTEAERLATEIIDCIDVDAHPQRVKAFVIRAAARSMLGRSSDADSDLKCAEAVAPHDPDRIRTAAQLRWHSGDDQGALELLRGPHVNDDAVLLALRARITAKADAASAARDLDAAIKLTPELRNSGNEKYDDRRLAIAHAALALDARDIARLAVDSISARGATSAEHALVLGRLALRHEDIDGAVAHYNEAAKRDAEQRVEVLAELGSKLVLLERFAEALTAFDTIGRDSLPRNHLYNLAVALMRTNALARARSLLEWMAQQSELPAWAIEMAISLAYRQEDTVEAGKHLEALIARGHGVSRARLNLCELLVADDRAKDAAPHIAALLQDSDLSPDDLMRLAWVLHSANRATEALPIALLAFRRAHQDPKIHRALVGLTIFGNASLPQPDSVGPDTYVKLCAAEGDKERHYIIYASAPVDPLRNEITEDAAATLKLTGKKLGDVLVENAGTWNEKRWRVDQLMSAIQFVANDCLQHYQERFPNEAFFVTGFQFGDGKSPRDLAPLIGSIEDRAKHVAETFRIYRERTLPRGFVAKMVGGSIPEVMQASIDDPDRCGPLTVEWVDRNGQQASKVAALNADTVAITRSGLKTAFDLGIQDLLSANYKIIAPVSLRKELRDELHHAEDLVREGRKMLGPGKTGLQLAEIEAGHPSLVKRLSEVRATLDWIESHAEKMPRPLEAIETPGSDAEKMRDQVGRSAWDAVILARQTSAAMYADDLGLRRFFTEGEKGSSFSTIGLLLGLAERGVISAAKKHEYLLTLIDRHYAVVPITAELIVAGARRAATTSTFDLAAVFDLLAAPAIDIQEAARITARALREILTAPVRLLSPERVTTYALSAMAKRWPPRLCARAIREAAARELALLPNDLRAVHQTCTSLLRGV